MVRQVTCSVVVLCSVASSVMQGHAQVATTPAHTAFVRWVSPSR